MIRTVGSVCSGIEAAAVAWEPLGLKFEWFSEIAAFPSKVLADKYRAVANLGDMNDIPSAILNEEISLPDLICGGTPCQAFSLAGWKNGLLDERGGLALKFVEIIEANDLVRARHGLGPCAIFWENVEGVLTDKTNAFGCLVSSLAGLSKTMSLKRWPNAGAVKGKKRNVAWRVIDAKYFGIPQQRRRLYVLAGGKEFMPENILYELHENELPDYPGTPLTFKKDGHYFEIFREYTDCLYSAYATKWNGNAAANNGSLFVVQDNRIRRFSPLECERLMGFPDDYTNIAGARRTNRYQAIGNSWAIPVIRWIGQRMVNEYPKSINLSRLEAWQDNRVIKLSDDEDFYNFGKGIEQMRDGITLNCSAQPENSTFASMSGIISPDAPESIYISPVGCNGIVRRRRERNLAMNRRLEEILSGISAQMPLEEIEQKSRLQSRGRYSNYQMGEIL